MCRVYTDNTADSRHPRTFRVMLGHQTCKNRRPYNLYCVGADVKPCSINQSLCFWDIFVNGHICLLVFFLLMRLRQCAISEYVQHCIWIKFALMWQLFSCLMPYNFTASFCYLARCYLLRDDVVLLLVVVLSISATWLVDNARQVTVNKVLWSCALLVSVWLVQYILLN